ncbi:hypothetical protein ACVNPS_06460 [Candidatus Bipolaricaulota sp. J31]
MRGLLVALCSLASLGAAGMGWSRVTGVICGELPPAWPPELVLPAGTRVLGAILFEEGGFAAFLELPGGVGAALAGLEENLARGGWERLPEQGAPEKILIFIRRSDAGEALFLHFVPGEVGLTVTYLPEVELDWLKREAEVAPHIPLELPEGVHLLGTHRAGSPWSVGLRGTVIGAASPGEIAASLGKGFTFQGWEPIDSGAEGPVAWGRYRLEREGELWELVFTLVAMPLRPNTYTLCVVAERLR